MKKQKFRNHPERTLHLVKKEISRRGASGNIGMLIKRVLSR